MKYTHFLNDEEKMKDFLILSKEEFLKSYSYLTEEEYDLTRDAYSKSLCPTYTWDELYERAMDKGYGSDELTAKDEARFELGGYILETEGYDIEDVSIYESAEEEIDYYLKSHNVLFNEYGNIVMAEGKQFGWEEEYDGILVWRCLCA